MIGRSLNPTKRNENSNVGLYQDDLMVISPVISFKSHHMTLG